MNTVVAAALGGCVPSSIGAPGMTAHPITKKQVKQAVGDMNKTLDLTSDPALLARVVASGILDAPQLVNNKSGRGRIRTAILDGACTAVDSNGRILSEARRLRSILRGDLR